MDSVARSASVTIAEDDKTRDADNHEEQIVSIDTVDTAGDADEKHVEDVIKRPIVPHSNNVMDKSIIAELNSKFKTKDISEKAQPVPPSPSDPKPEPEDRIRKKSLIPVYQGPNLNKNGSMSEDGERSLNQVMNQKSEDSDLVRNSVSSINQKSDVGSAEKSKITVHQNSISGPNSSKNSDPDRNSTSSAGERSRKKSLIPVYQGSPSDRNSSEETEEDINTIDRKSVNSKSKIPLSARSSSFDTNVKPMVGGSRASKPPKLPMLPSHPKPTSGVSPQTAPVSLNSTPTDGSVFSFKPSDPKESKLVTGEIKSSAALKLPMLPSKPKPTQIVSQKSAPTLASTIPTDDRDVDPSFDSKVPQKSIRTQRLDDAIKELENEFKEENGLENKTLKLPMLPNKPKPFQADPPKTPPSSPADVKILSFKSLDQEESKPLPLIAEAKSTKTSKLPLLPSKPKPSAPVSHKTAPILPSEVQVFRYTSLHEEVAPMSSPSVDCGEDSVTLTVSDKGESKDSEKQQQSTSSSDLSKIPRLSIPTSDETKSSEQDDCDEDMTNSFDARVPLPQKSIRTQRLDDAILELETELKEDEDLENEKRVKVTRRPTGHRHTMI